MSSPKNYSQIIQNLWGKIKARVAFIYSFICPEANLTSEEQQLMEATQVLLEVDGGFFGRDLSAVIGTRIIH
jgi:hypothetical protein